MSPKTSVTITLIEDAHGNVSVRTDLPKPAMGAPLSQAQALGLDLITHCRHQRREVLHGARHVPALALALDLIDPNAYGWQTLPSVYRHALQVLGHGPAAQPAAITAAAPTTPSAAGAPA